MKIGSLFSGIGGLELGLEWAGVGHTVWQVEIDPFCRKVLAQHWSDAQRFEDVKTVGAHNLSPVDVICGGYPCQPFSTAGERLGEDDDRHLWPEFARILRALRPRYAVLENVAAHLSLGFGTVLGDLADLGYDAEWSVLSACAVGAPHSRERLFCVAYPKRDGQLAILAGDDETQGNGRFTTQRGEDRLLSEMAPSGGAVRGRWPDPPDITAMVDGLPVELATRAFGNAVVPQVAEVVGRRLLAIDAELREAVA